MTTKTSQELELLFNEYKIIHMLLTLDDEAKFVLKGGVIQMDYLIDMKHRTKEIDLCMENNRGSVFHMNIKHKWFNNITIRIHENWVYFLDTNTNIGNQVCIEWTDGMDGFTFGVLDQMDNDGPYCVVSGKSLDLAGEGHSNKLWNVVGRLNDEIFKEEWLSKQRLAQTANKQYF